MGTPLPIQAASLGMADSLILMVLALVVFGPRRLPQIGRQIGKLMYEFRKASNDFKFQMEEELRNSEEADRRKKEEERLRTLALNAPPPASPASETQPALPADVSKAAVEANPYPWDAVYPPMSAPEPEAAPAADAATAEAETVAPASEPILPEAGSTNDPEATHVPLAVQPPTTGQVVAANPPTHAARTEAGEPEDVTTHLLEAENMPPRKQPDPPPSEDHAPEQATHG